jgi:putative toxin-antitoxin system antitoxin component (TIGR02293 family)
MMGQVAHRAPAWVTMSETDRIVQFLGGRSAVAPGTRGEVDFVAALRRGLSASAFRNATEALRVPASELTRMLGLSRRTLTRRKARLSTTESSRLFRLARIHARAAEVLDGPDAATRWLRRPQRALGGEVPMALLDTDAGALAVERLLGRIGDAVVT